MFLELQNALSTLMDVAVVLFINYLDILSRKIVKIWNVSLLFFYLIFLYIL